MTSARVLAFAALDPLLWGVAWAPESAGSTLLAVAAGPATATLPVALDAAEPSGTWGLAGEDVALAVTPTAATRQGHDPAGRLATVDSLCTVTGRVAFGGAGHELSAPAWRSGLEAELELRDVGSFRHVAGWTPSGDLVAVVALRPRKARGQERDVAAGTVLDPAESPAVAEPRLSTTYTEAGEPRRTSLELWFEEPADEPEDAAAHYPRRAAGEAVGASISWEASGFWLRAVLLRWYTRGEEGSGIYLLGQRA